MESGPHSWLILVQDLLPLCWRAWWTISEKIQYGSTHSYLNYYVLDENWMLSLGGIPSILIFVYHVRSYRLWMIWRHPLAFLFLWLFLSKTVLFVCLCGCICWFAFMYLATHNNMCMWRNWNFFIYVTHGLTFHSCLSNLLPYICMLLLFNKTYKS